MRAIGLILAVSLLVPTVFGGEAEEKIRAAKKKIAALLREAEELQEAGRTEEARRVREKAEQWQAELKAWAKEHGGHKHRDSAKRLHGVLRGLEQGIEACLAIGRKEEAAHLKEIAAGVRRRLEDMERGHERNREVEVAKKQLETLRIAMKTLAEAKRHDAAERIEHAIHAGELRLERRRDEAAERVYRTAPKAEQMVELLFLAAEILADRGKRDLAHRVHALGRMYQDRLRRGREHEERRRHERERERVEHRERGDELHRLARRVDMLEERLAKVTNLLEEIVRRQRRDR